jgi:2-polyprenyl-3-methyl-5-hydroxy-6-metoxy-1,4-benzoquinol methylase
MDEAERRQARAFAELTYEGFRELAGRADLSRYQRIGFPDSLRAGREAAIFDDIRAKLPALEAGRGLRVLDIGPGCSDLPGQIIETCRARGHEITLVDSPEMLAALPDAPFIRKVEGPFPQCAPALEGLRGQVDLIICYSVLHYVFAAGPLFGFLDAAMALLRPGGGAMLIGDVPNASMRRRFLASAAGATFHRQYTGRDEDPVPGFNQPAEGEMDDAVLFSLVARARAAGVDAWILPQPPGLPMANRREDLLLRRP